MGFVAAGNTTLQVRTARCPRLGCPRKVTDIRAVEARAFAWSNTTQWKRADVPGWKPAEYKDLEIPAKWVVTLDTVTPILRILTIRGKLLFNTSGSGAGGGLGC